MADITDTDNKYEECFMSPEEKGFAAMEDAFCEIVDKLLDYHAEAQSNEGCGPFGNDDVSLYAARDLARKHKLNKVLENLSFGHGDDITAEEYAADRNSKIDQWKKENDSKEIKRLESWVKKLREKNYE